MDLSILIPARNEQFLARTIEDIVINIQGNTEVIAVLDGQWSKPSITQHSRVTVVYLPESIGQRAATNLAARLSTAKYVMKVDAHCAFDKGFDVKMIKAMEEEGENVTMAPTMRNLHAFDWVCKEGHRRYQGPSGPCKICGKKTEQEIVWIAKKSPQSNAYRFDETLHFQYHKEWEKLPQNQKQIIETMSLQGSCFMLTRAKYWELDICDEAFGSWGQQGVEVACKTWLSGGRVLINKNTWYAHMFRTQGGDFGFPYPLTGTEVDHARQYSRNLFQNNQWPKAIHPFQWLIDKFGPLPGWHGKSIKKGIIYYTDNRLDEAIFKTCQGYLVNANLPIVSVSLKPIDFGKNIVLPLERGYLTMAKQILAALEASDADVIFFAEHDVLYHSSHFAFTPESKEVYYYNENVWQVRLSDNHALYYDCKKLSQLCGYRDFLIKHFKERVRRIEVEGFSRKMGFEPGTHNRKERIDDFKAATWRSQYSNIDIRHEQNLTSSRWKKEEFRDQRNCQNWQEADEIEGWDIKNLI